MTPLSRRSFLCALATPLATPASGRTTAHAHARLCFSTLGCPAWNWKTILAQAAANGYAGIELRGLGGEMDLTKRAEFQAGRMAATRGDLAALDLEIVCLGSSARMHEADPTLRAAQLDEGRRFIDLARALGARHVRVFGDELPGDQPRETTIARVVEGLGLLGAHAAGSGVTVVIESHGDFTDSATLRRLLSAVDRPEVALLWDAHHTFVAAGEAPETTWRQVGSLVRHTHLKDSRLLGDGARRYVLTGAGNVPVRETLAVLQAGGYRGYYGFEWEKAWHPEIEEPEIALPHFASTVRRYLSDAFTR